MAVLPSTVFRLRTAVTVETASFGNQAKTPKGMRKTDYASPAKHRSGKGNNSKFFGLLIFFFFIMINWDGRYRNSLFSSICDYRLHIYRIFPICGKYGAKVA